MTMKGDPERTALVLVTKDLANLDAHFADLTSRAPRQWPFKQNPRHEPGDQVLLGSFGPEGTGALYVFVGKLTGCKYRRAEKILTYEHVERFWCPVVAAFGDEVLRDDLLGDRELWGPHEFNYVLPAALDMVPVEARALLCHDPRRRAQ